MRPVGRIMRYIVPEDGSPEMNDQALARCREMGIDELAGFIRGSLERMDEPNPEQDRPHDHEEFLAMWRMLRGKADAMPPDPVPPPDALDKAYDKRARTERFLYDDVPGKSKPSKKQRQSIERDLDRLNQQIEQMEASGKYDSPPSDPNTPRQVAARTASEIFHEIEAAFKRRPTRRRLQWRIGRSGSLSLDGIRSSCEAKQSQDPEFKYDINRIEKAYELGPDGPPYEGADGFDGYVIFTYRTKRALMECAEIGNAAYVIHKDWEDWSQMDKQELIAEAERGGEVTRIPHTTEDWPTKVRQALGLDHPASA